jgi:hypothetical protein
MTQLWRGREIRDYSYAKDDFKDASLIPSSRPSSISPRLASGILCGRPCARWHKKRFGVVELRSRALQEAGTHLDVVFPNYPVFNRLSLASKAVLSGDPDPDRIAALSFDDFVAETRKAYEGGRLSRSTRQRIREAAQRSWGLGGRAAGSKIRLAMALQRQRFMADQGHRGRSTSARALRGHWLRRHRRDDARHDVDNCSDAVGAVR